MTDPRQPYQEGEESNPDEYGGQHYPDNSQAPAQETYGDQQPYDPHAYADQQDYDPNTYGALPTDGGHEQYHQQDYAAEPAAYDPNAYDPSAYGGPAQGEHHEYDQQAYDQQYGAEGEQAYSEPAGSFGHDSLADMYVQKEKLERKPLTIREGMPEEESEGRSIGPIIGVLVLVFVGLICFTGLFVIKQPIVDEQGMDQRVSMATWLQLQLTMSPEQRRMQTLSADERAFVITSRRMGPALQALVDFNTFRGEVPQSVSQLVDSGMLEDAFSKDGWENDFLIRRDAGQLSIVSGGPDGVAGTADDLLLNNSRFQAPPEFENLRFMSGIE
jgi:hypothetical protein